MPVPRLHARQRAGLRGVGRGRGGHARSGAAGQLSETARRTRRRGGTAGDAHGAEGGEPAVREETRGEDGRASGGEAGEARVGLDQRGVGRFVALIASVLKRRDGVGPHPNPRFAPRPSRCREGVHRHASQWLANMPLHPGGKGAQRSSRLRGPSPSPVGRGVGVRANGRIHRPDVRAFEPSRRVALSENRCRPL
ncbi:hypothetical protein LUTEI9C_80191 [Luteimonas sp. 9C]|nr:hypothetical protein LUTEI9C_80191 [Luteimonas sp. 9C]